MEISAHVTKKRGTAEHHSELPKVTSPLTCFRVYLLSITTAHKNYVNR